MAEYRKPEYEISAETDKPEYIQGEQINVTVQANYFFGGPVKGGKVNWVLLSSDYSFITPVGQAAEGYWSFERLGLVRDARRSARSAAQLSQGEGVTDAEGRFTFSVPADISKFTQSQRFTFDITVQDVNNQAVSTQAYCAWCTRASSTSACGRSATSRPSASRARWTCITVDPQSQPVPKSEVTLVVNQVEWYSVREQAEDGSFYWTSRPKKTPVFTQTLTTDADGLAVLEWTPNDAGEYKIEATGRDKAGHTHPQRGLRLGQRPRVRQLAAGEQRPHRAGGRQRRVQRRRHGRDPGRQPLPGPVKALLTIERNHVLSHKVIEIAGNSEVLRLPIDADHAPNIFVSLILMKGMDETSPAPSFKMGLKQLKVSVADKQLQVDLDPAQGRLPRSDHRTADGAPTGRAARHGRSGRCRRSTPRANRSRPRCRWRWWTRPSSPWRMTSAGKLMDRFYSQRSLGITHRRHAGRQRGSGGGAVGRRRQGRRRRRRRRRRWPRSAASSPTSPSGRRSRDDRRRMARPRSR